MRKNVEKHPLAIRWFHWVNFPLLGLMVWSGLLIYWAYRPYKLQVGGTVLLRFFPDWFYKALGVPFRLAEGMSWHFAAMWVFGINGVLYAAYLAFSGQWRHLLPDWQAFAEAGRVVLHDLGLRRQPPPVRKYNGAQRIAYTAVLLMGVASVVTGLAIYKPVQLAWLVWLLGGYQSARMLHFALTIGFVLFFAVHVVQVLRAGWNTFKGMVDGLAPPAPKGGAKNSPPLWGGVGGGAAPPSGAGGLFDRRRTLKAFAWFGAAGLVPFGVWKWVLAQPREGGLPRPLRRVLQGNAYLADVFYDPARLAPTYPKARAARRVRVNGLDGLRTPLDDAWRLHVRQPGRPDVAFTLAQVQALPRQEIVFEFKCIEGWSQIQHWGGVRLADFLAHHGLGRRTAAEGYRYMGLETPDGGYYVGLDMASALHPQTLLCFEMNGKPLETAHGAPLRLIIPVKYGVKNLKRIGRITFSDTPPRDFWAERGYDYHIGL